MSTDNLIRALAVDLQRQRVAPRPAVWRRLLLATAVAAMPVLLIIDVGLAPSPHLKHGITATIAFTVAAALALAGGSYAAALSLSRPDSQGGALWMLVPLAVLLLGIGLELGRTPRSSWLAHLVGDKPLACFGLVTLLSLPILAAALLALRQGAPTRPRLLGAVAGLLAGGVASALYTLHCPEDSLLFITAWHVPAVLVVAAFGAGLSRRVLRW